VGHKYRDIQDYTLSQIIEFSKAAVRFYHLQEAVTLNVTAMGARGEGKAIEAEIMRLVRGDE
jgi:hypothetical protein